MRDHPPSHWQLTWRASAILVAVAMGPVPAFPVRPVALSAQSVSRLVITTSTAGVPQPSAAALAFTGVTVIDVTTGRFVPGQTVIITGNRVQAVGPMDRVRVPTGAHIVDAQGKYLIPGLWDMHTHVDARIMDYPRFIASGVTGIRELAQRSDDGLDSFRVWQAEVMAGTRIGPRSIGPSADLTNPRMLFRQGADPRKSGTFHFPRDKDPSVVMAEMKKDYGITFVKYHGDTSADQFFRLLRAAHQVGFPFVGHVPENVSSIEASDSGMRSIEHTVEIRECFSPPSMPRDSITMDAGCAPVVAAFVRNGTWFTPTTVFWVRRQDTEGFQAESLKYVRMKKYPYHGDVVRRMSRLGFKRFLAGTDYAAVAPGLSLLQELVLFGRAGLTPLEALRTATLYPAQFLGGTDSLGTVAPGKLADLVLLDADPLADISNVMRIRAVVANGRYFDRAALDSLDPDVPKRAEQFAQDVARLATFEAERQAQVKQIPKPALPPSGNP